MKLKSKLTALAVASALMGSTAATAAPVSLITPDGTLNNWTGIDWNALASAAITGFVPVAGDNFDITFWATASILYNAGTNYAATNMYTGPGSTGSYEYTIFGQLNESNISCSLGGVSCQFQVNSGSFSVYYDTSANSNYVTGLGFTDGTLLFSGIVPPQYGGSFTAISTTTGIGVSALLGLITYTNPAYIDPALTNANSVTTLQIGGLTTAGYQTSTGMPGVAGAATAIPQGAIVMQADMNMGISAVPEPASLALLGLGLFGLGALRRKA